MTPLSLMILVIGIASSLEEREIKNKEEKKRLLACLGIARARASQDSSLIDELIKALGLSMSDYSNSRKEVMDFGLVNCFNIIERDQTDSIMNAVNHKAIQIDSLSKENKHLLGLEKLKTKNYPKNYEKKRRYVNKLLDEITTETLKEKNEKLNQERVNKNEKNNFIAIFLEENPFIAIIGIILFIFFFFRLLRLRSSKKKIK